MDRHSKPRYRSHVVLFACGAVFAALSVGLFEGKYVRRLIASAAADSADLTLSVLTAAWWFLGAWLTATLLAYLLHRFMFPFDDQPKRRKIFSDLASALIYLIAAFGALQFAFHQPIAGMLATSGVVAVILGLALQSTLSDLFSGLALNIETPFRAGDWITVDGTTEGQVIEINWRATRIREFSGDITIVPNSLIARLRVTNHSMHVLAHQASVDIKVKISGSMVIAETALLGAVSNASHVLKQPPPEVSVESVIGQTVAYCLSFYVDDYADVRATQCEVLKNVLASVSDSTIQMATTLADGLAAMTPH